MLARTWPRPSFALAASARAAGLRASVYLGSSGKLGKQLRWAVDQGARWCLIYGHAEREAGAVTVRDLVSASQEAVPAADGRTATWPRRRARGGAMAEPPFTDPDTWFAGLPGVVIAAGALITDPAGRVLLVKPNYRERWALPGGICELGEPPQVGCGREVAEELGMDMPVGRLLATDWVTALRRPRPGR